MEIISKMKLIAPQPGTRIVHLGHDYVGKPLLTEVEAKFFEQLELLAGGRCRIMCKPRMADFVQHLGSGFQKISQKHVDFLIFRLGDWMPMLAIELDDSSHDSKEASYRDTFKNNLCAHLGLPLLRINVREIENLHRLVKELSSGWERRCQQLGLPNGQP